MIGNAEEMSVNVEIPGKVCAVIHLNFKHVYCKSSNLQIFEITSPYNVAITHPLWFGPLRGDGNNFFLLGSTANTNLFY